MKIEIISKDTIEPSSQPPPHLRTYKLSLLDQISPPYYVPVVLFYPAPNPGLINGADAVDHNTVFNSLQKSLSEALSVYYPLAGRIRGDDPNSVDLHGGGALFVKARVPGAPLSGFLANPDLDLIGNLLPLDPYNVGGSDSKSDLVVTAIQASIFECGGISLGVCISHRVADGATLSTFLDYWAASSIGSSRKLVSPSLDAAILFPPRDEFRDHAQNDVIRKEKVVTKRFVFESSSLASLRESAAKGSSIGKPTLVEAVTALICKSAMKARKHAHGTEGQTSSSTVITHIVNLRGRRIPPLPEHSLGNIWRFAIAAIREEASKVELCDLVGHLRQSIRKIDADYVRKLEGEDGFYHACESFKEMSKLKYEGEGEVESYRFSSWVRFPFYEVDFGFGKPVWACNSKVPIRNVVILMATRSGDGIETWVTLDEDEMHKFMNDPLLLQFTATS
ncbi:stemmadenine O-acetyltransferase-like [Punica granatum]|uniref:Stemmadenine O-acetyltransferase-like n=1 Tax=Punica granatum TaxID=22663 RepID=A0A218XYK8_PUNGR|nr:stemmadenine O-acetyltransferase-like [Punica granatum]OWM89726.1 hypothetical protein CDL15_Pgr024474 [Punica granatum]